jgi:isoquinoline 1-oxidoreductase alpha subunit
MPKYTLQVNGQSRSVDVAADTPLLWVLRDHLELVGTKFGCGIGQCGACTIHVNGVPSRSCMTPVSTVGRMKITTIEGMANGEALHPVQQAFSECHGLQCGYCTPGMVMAVTDLLRRNPKPTDEQILHGLEGNICRCTGYINIVKSVTRASELMAAG